MNVNPNKFDVRVLKKFKDQLNLTDKDIESELKGLKEENPDRFDTVTGGSLEKAESIPPHSPQQN
jgi:hypothetical protein